jgi:hypothetical protein
MQEKMLDERQAAERLTVAFWTMRNWRRLNKGPPYIKVGGHVRYRESDLQAFIEKRLHDPEGCLQTSGKNVLGGALLKNR